MQLHRIALVQDALFAVDERVFAIGRKTQHRDLAAVVAVIEDIPVVGLLVQAEEQTHPAPERDVQVPDGLQRKQAGNHRAFVVDGPPAKESAVHDLGPIGRVMPALAFGHDVQMAQHGHHLVAGTDLAPANVPVKVGRLESQLAAEGQRLCKAGVHICTEGLAGQLRPFHALLPHQPLQSGGHFRPQGGNGFVQRFLHRAIPSRDRRW